MRQPLGSRVRSSLPGPPAQRMGVAQRPLAEPGTGTHGLQPTICSGFRARRKPWRRYAKYEGATRMNIGYVLGAITVLCSLAGCSTHFSTLKPEGSTATVI